MYETTSHGGKNEIKQFQDLTPDCMQKYQEFQITEKIDYIEIR